MKYFLLNPVMGANTIKKEETVEKKLYKLGLNTGNMVFVNSIKQQIEFAKEGWVNADMEWSDKYTYVLPCSNFLHGANRWMEPLTDIVEKYPVKVVLIGLGTQAKLNENPQNVLRGLSDKQKRFFQVVAERCKSIGVRGEYTAECLNLLGVKNSEIIGCPSAYKYMNGKFPVLREPSFERSIVTITPLKGLLTTNLLKMGIKEKSSWIMQSKDEIVEMYSSNVIMRQLRKDICFPGIGWNKLIKYQDNHAKLFWNFKDWNQYIEEGDFSFAYGTRFHGNMMALRNAVPTLWFIHDIRTWELVRTLKVPSVEYSNITWKSFRKEELLEKCDYSDFYKSYEYITSKYRIFLNENGIQGFSEN